MSANPDRYAVFGNPISQSRSPQIHSLFAAQTGQDMSYSRECIPLDGFSAAVRRFFAEGGKGLNVTVPFKQEAYELADQLSERARLAGAVNTLLLTDTGQIFGDNTDGYGLVSDITERLGWGIEGKRVLVLGAGGAVRGVLHPLLQQRPRKLAVANRTLAKAEELAQAFAAFGQIEARAFYRPDEQPFDLIINGTSASLAGELPPLNPACIAPSTCAYDMVYSKTGTPFLTWAGQQGASRLADGIGMLVGQAAESFYLWRGRRPDVAAVIAELAKAQ